MAENTRIKLFEDKKVRTIWDEEAEEWYFSVVDVVAVLTESPNPRKYWSVLKTRLKTEGSQLATNCSQLKMPATDGKMYKTDCMTTEQLFRLIQSIPSPKAEPFKLWMAQVAKERLDEMQDPEQGIQRALLEYRALGYSENWINQRLKSIEIRKDLTDEWKKHGLKEGVQFATLTDIIYKTWAGKSAKEYKEYKGLKKENLRDNMTNKELVLNMLAELSTKEISESSNPQDFDDHIQNAVDGATIAKNARIELEQKTGKKVVTPLNARDGIGLTTDTKASVLLENEDNATHGGSMLLYEEETGKILKACMNVFNELGNGFLEAVYQEALAIEFEEMHIPFEREAKINIFYRGKKLDKEYYADFICYDKIIVELKAISKLVNANKAQVINYLHGTKLLVGLLVNFGESSLKWERLTLLKNDKKE